MVSFPPCKINLGLNIIGKRSDGYHDILTCFYPVPWKDILEIVPARNFAFTMSGHTVPGAVKDNLCFKAYECLKKEFKLPPVLIHLHKVVPIGAGLGGGSADGALTLKVLNERFELGLTEPALEKYAATLGSDCAFFIENKPRLGSGRGDVLSETSLTLKGYYLVIVKPEVRISTAEAYAEVSPRPPGIDIKNILENQPLHQWKGLLKNDFEDNLFARFPVMEAIHQKLYSLGAAYASVSGSGSAVYGIFENETDLQKEFEGFEYWSGHLD